MAINEKKSAIQLNIETPLPKHLQDIPRLDETTYKYLGFEMKKGEIERASRPLVISVINDNVDYYD